MQFEQTQVEGNQMGNFHGHIAVVKGVEVLFGDWVLAKVDSSFEVLGGEDFFVLS